MNLSEKEKVHSVVFHTMFSCLYALFLVNNGRFGYLRDAKFLDFKLLLITVTFQC